MSTATDLEGQVLGGRYRIVRTIGKGGMGGVYEAVRLDLGSSVAVKVIAKELVEEPEYIERFRREAMAAAQLGHPNIVQVTDFQHPDGEAPFLVMELLRGDSLIAELRRGALEPKRAVDIAIQVLAGLHAAHAHGIVHRDLKPANVFLVPMAAGRILVKLVDFGVAKLMDSTLFSRLTQTGVLIGTPRYAAPEQVTDSKSVDPRSDVYSAGVLLYCMLGGRPPFLSKGARLLVDIETAEPPALESLIPTLDPTLTAIVQRAMLKRREQRFQTAQGFADALISWSSGAPVALPPVTRISAVPPVEIDAATQGERPAHRQAAQARPAPVTRVARRRRAPEAAARHTPAPQAPAQRGTARHTPAPHAPARHTPAPHVPARHTPAPQPQRRSSPHGPAEDRPTYEPTHHSRRPRHTADPAPARKISLPLLITLGVLVLGLTAVFGAGITYLVGMLRSPHGEAGEAGSATLTPGGDEVADCLEWEQRACDCYSPDYRRVYCPMAREARTARGATHYNNCAQWAIAMRQSCTPMTEGIPVRVLPAPPPIGVPECDEMGRLACTCGSGPSLSSRCARARTFLDNIRDEPASEVVRSCQGERANIDRLCHENRGSVSSP